MADIVSDLGVNLLEEEIDEVIFQTNQFLTDATFTGSQGQRFVPLVRKLTGQKRDKNQIYRFKELHARMPCSDYLCILHPQSYKIVPS